MRIRLAAFLPIIVIFIAGGQVFAASAEKPEDNRVVKDGMLVSLDYTVKTPDGKVLETSKGSRPLQYIHGKKMMIPGLEKELTGMKIGAEKHVTVKPEEGYGKLNPKAGPGNPEGKDSPQCAQDWGGARRHRQKRFTDTDDGARDQRKNRRNGLEPSARWQNASVRRESRRHRASAARRQRKIRLVRPHSPARRRNRQLRQKQNEIQAHT
jgi:hypothetical protein